MSPVPLPARVADSRREIAHLRQELREWLKTRRGRDTQHQFHTQLAVLETVLSSGLDGIEAALPSTDAIATARDVESCRRVDRAAVWMRRVWMFFRSRFDQRDDPRFAPLLAAADEVVWSCYAAPFRVAGRDVPSAPLAYVEDRFTPFAIPRVNRPPDLRLDIDAAFLAEFLGALPIPILGLPPTTIERPWGLVFVGHEAGHHVQFDLVAASGLDTTFPAQLAAAVEQGHGAAAAKRWAPWHREIFADAWSIVTMGPAALLAFIELEDGVDARLLQRHPDYPPPVVRIALMHALATALDLAAAGDEALGALRPSGYADGAPILVDAVDLRSELAADLKVVPTVAAMLANETIAHGLTLADLAGWPLDFSSLHSVDDWRASFRAANPPVPIELLEAARLATSGATWAWADLQALPLDTREGARRTLRDRATACVAACREQSVRAGARPPAFAAETAGDRLRSLLLGAPEPVPEPITS